MIIRSTEIRKGVLKALANADELLDGAKLLLNKRLLSAYALIILALEEIGKAVLLWKDSHNFTEDVQDPHWFRRKMHPRKVHNYEFPGLGSGSDYHRGREITDLVLRIDPGRIASKQERISC